jgi:dTDP-4-dehydrorhamnose reductase
MSEEGAVLVAGRAGQVARCLVHAARGIDLPLIALGRPDLDITNAESIGRAVTAIKPSLIINAAAYTAVDNAEVEPECAFAINCRGAGRLAAAAGAASIPFIHISSDYVFDGRKCTPYVEDDPPSPLGVYGQSKLDGEMVVRSACPGAVVLRTSWIYSPYGQNFAKTMLRLADTRDVVSVVDDQFGAPTAAGDLASAILAVAKSIKAGRSGEHGGLYHLTARGSTTWHGFAEAIFADWERRGRHVPQLKRISAADYPTKAVRPANSRLDCTKIERVHGIRLPHWQDSVNECLDALAEGPAEAK